jgi:hypothetical protein
MDEEVKRHKMYYGKLSVTFSIVKINQLHQ